jgi:integrase
MPYVVKHAGGETPFWYAVYRDEAGKRRKRSTKQTSKSKALEIAHALQRAANEARQGRLTEARTRDLLSEVLKSVNGEGLRTFTVEQWFDHFVKRKQKSRADKTALRHEQMMNQFVGFLGYKAKLNIAIVTSRDITDFRDRRESFGLAPSTLNTDIDVLSAAFNAALKQGHISVNPCAAIEPLKDKLVHKSVFTPEQVTAILKAVGEMEFAAPRGGKLDQQSNEMLRRDWRGLILTAFYTGLRLGDAASLQWKHIDLVSEIKTIRFNQGKTGDEIITVVHPALEDYLLSLPAPKTDEAFLFPSLAQQAQRHVSPLSKAFRKIMQRARIEQSVIRERSESSESGRKVYALSFHSLRHSFASILANAGVSEELRMALTGHTERQTHKRYTHHELTRLRDAIAVLPRIQ